MTEEAIPHPPITTPDDWRQARKVLLAREKEATRTRDAVSAARRRLPMVRIAQDYTFNGPNGTVRLVDLFEGRRQLIVYHFMFDPAWEQGCSGCTGFVNALGDLSMLAERDTTMVLIARAPLEKLERYKAAKGWTLPWLSSYGSEFNYDFHVTQDANHRPIEYNYLDQAELDARGEHYFLAGESHGLSVFFRLGAEVFHTYSTYARGVEGLTDAYSLLDVTPYGRQEDWEDSPEGWPQRPTYG